MPLPPIAVFRDVMWNANEPFIFSQGQRLERYSASYFAVRRVAELKGGPEPCHVVNRGDARGRLHEFALKQFGINPPMLLALRRSRAQLLHAYTGVDGAVALPIARQLRIPLVVTFTGFDANASDAVLRQGSRRCKVYLRRRDALGRQADLILVVSDFLRRKLVAQGYPEQRIVVHHVGVDTATFQADPGVAREPVVLCVGRLLEVKGFAHAIAAVHEVRKRLPQLRLVVCGDGPLRQRLEQQARDLGVPAEFAGNVPPAEIRRWMNRARALVVPSVRAATGETEALPMVALEAQAMSLPVAGFDSGGISEAVADSGRLAPEADVKQLAAHLEGLLSNDALWHEASIAGRRNVLERFDLQRQTAALEDLYDQVLARRCGNASSSLPTASSTARPTPRADAAPRAPSRLCS